MRKCFIHIGTHKSGTTAIQWALSGHESTLAQHGYLYPVTGRIESLPGHHNIAWRLKDDRRFRSEKGTPDELVNEIKSSDLDVLLSSEDFLGVYVDHFSQFTDFVERIRSLPMRVVVVIYLRNQVDYLRSNYLERVKGSMFITFKEYLDRQLGDKSDEYSHDYCELLSGFDRFPDVELIVRSYDAVKDHLIEDFLSILDLIPARVGVDSTLRVNAEQPLVVSFKSFYRNRMGRPVNDVESDIIDSMFAVMPTTNLAISNKMRARINDRYSASNARVAHRYGLPGFGDMRATATQSSDEVFVLDNVFSAELPYFVDTLAKRLSGAGRQSEPRIVPSQARG